VGYDAGKKVKGRKTMPWSTAKGCRCGRRSSPAIQDRDRAGLVLDKIRRRFPWRELIWADGGYNAWQVDAAVAKVLPLRMTIVKRSDDEKGFVMLPRRWVSSAPSPGSDATGVSPRISRTSPKPWPPSLPSPLSSWPSGGLFGSSSNLDKRRSR